MAGIGPKIQESSTRRTVVSFIIFLILCALALQACGNPVTLEFDTECIDLRRISAVDPPGVGGYNDVFVTTGLDNPLLCGDVELGDLEFNNEDPYRFEPLSDIRRRYTIGGLIAETDEAFFEMADRPANKIGLPLLGLRPSDGVWQFEAPGVRLPLHNLRGDVISFRKGDGPDGYTTQLQFSLLLDSRVRIVEVMFWRLVRESDGDGPNVNQEVVASWFGEQNVRLGNRMRDQHYWGVELEDYPNPSQLVDKVFAQCDIDDRVQFRLLNYQDVVVDDNIVDNFFLNEDGSCPSGMADGPNHWVTQFENEGLVVRPERGQLSVFLSRGAWRQRGGGCFAQDIGTSWGRYIALSEDRLSATGSALVLAHELGHTLDQHDCVNCPGNLMASQIDSVGENLTVQQCQAIGEYE